MRDLLEKDCFKVVGGVDLGTVLTSVAVCVMLDYYRDAIKTTFNNLFNQSTKASNVSVDANKPSA